MITTKEHEYCKSKRVIFSRFSRENDIATYMLWVDHYWIGSLGDYIPLDMSIWLRIQYHSFFFSFTGEEEKKKRTGAITVFIFIFSLSVPFDHWNIGGWSMQKPPKSKPCSFSYKLTLYSYSFLRPWCKLFASDVLHSLDNDTTYCQHSTLSRKFDQTFEPLLFYHNECNLIKTIKLRTTPPNFRDILFTFGDEPALFSYTHCTILKPLWLQKKKNQA